MATVDIEEMDEALDERVRSETIDSGLEPEDAVLIDGRRDGSLKRSMFASAPGYASSVQRLMPALCANAMAVEIDGRREPP